MIWAFYFIHSVNTIACACLCYLINSCKSLLSSILNFRESESWMIHISYETHELFMYQFLHLLTTFLDCWVEYWREWLSEKVLFFFSFFFSSDNEIVINLFTSFYAYLWSFIMTLMIYFQTWWNVCDKKISIKSCSY